MRQTSPWAGAGSEPTIADLLLDPIAQALMQADGVFVDEVLAIVTACRNRRNSLAVFRRFADQTIDSRSENDQ